MIPWRHILRVRERPTAALRLVALFLAALFLPTDATAQPATAPSPNPLASLDKNALKAFVEQPLFEPSRHPPVVAAPVVVDVPPPPPPVEPPPSVRLLGVVEGKDALAAIVHRLDTGRTETLHAGDRIGGWYVEVGPTSLRVVSGVRAYDYSLFRVGALQGPVPVEPTPSVAAPTVAAGEAPPAAMR